MTNRVESLSKAKRQGPQALAMEPVPQSALYSEDAEKAVLGCMLSQPAEVINDVVETLSAGDFYHPSHKVVFEALRALHDVGAPIDVMVVHQYLTDKKVAEDVGSPGFLGELLVGYATHLHVAAYIRIVKDKAMIRSLQGAISEIAQDIADSPDQVAAVLDRAESLVFAITSIQASQGIRTGPEEIRGAIALIEKLQVQKGNLKGIPTGFHKLDELTTGWQPGDMVVLAARPGQGKTALALTFARHALHARYDEVTDTWVKPGHKVGIFSLEMTNAQLMLRMLASYASESLQRIRQGKLDEHALQKLRMTAADMESLPLVLDDSSFLTINQLRAKARRMKQRWGLDLLIVDYLQLLRSESKQSQDNRQNEVAEISRGIKALAKELKIPIIILAQLNRKSEEGKQEPALHNLRESGAIEQDADMVLLLHRKQLDEDDAKEAPVQQAAIIPYTLNVAKQRNGPTDHVDILFHSYYTRFDDPVRHETRTT